MANVGIQVPGYYKTVIEESQHKSVSQSFAG